MRNHTGNRLYCTAVHSGLVAQLGYLVEDAMVSVCWTGSNLEGFIKALKFIELSAFNMFAVTNLAICINLALVASVSGDKSPYLHISISEMSDCFFAWRLMCCRYHAYATRANTTCFQRKEQPNTARIGVLVHRCCLPPNPRYYTVSVSSIYESGISSGAI